MTTRINRRALLGLIAVSAAVAGCNGLSSGVTTAGVAATVGAQLVADVQGLASGLQAQFPAVASALTSAQATQVQGYLTTLASLASSVNTTLTATAAQPTVQQIVAVVQQIAAVAGPVLPPPWGLAISAAVSLLPVIASGVGLVIASAQTAAAPMPPAQARVVLGIRAVQ